MYRVSDPVDGIIIHRNSKKFQIGKIYEFQTREISEYKIEKNKTCRGSNVSGWRRPPCEPFDLLNRSGAVFSPHLRAAGDRSGWSPT